MFDGQHRTVPKNRKQRRAKFMRDSNFPDRPDHDDFWRLSRVLLDMDSRADNGEDVLAIASEAMDLKSLVYMARQRALRAHEMLAGADGVQKLSASWIDAFLAGVEYQKSVSEGRKVERQ